MSISVSRGTPQPAARQRAITTYSKYRAAPDFAVTRKEDNDTPAQSQSEHIRGPRKVVDFLGRGGAMERKSLAARGKATIAKSAPTMSQAMRAALADRQLR